jgi:hypothetical protein
MMTKSICPEHRRAVLMRRCYLWRTKQALTYRKGDPFGTQRSVIVLYCLDKAATNMDAITSMASGMAATQWLDLESIRHYRVYFLDRRNAILESAWDSNSTEWKTSVVASPDLKVQNRSSLGAAVGWPHANHSWTHVS